MIEHADIEQTRRNIFFIAGTSRSGSTLLQSMLNSHSQVVIPPETHFFEDYEHLVSLYSSDQRERYRRRLIDFWYDQKTRMRDLGLPKEQVLEAARKLNLYTPLELFLLQMTLYRLERGMERIGEKTPRHILRFNRIGELIPQAKLISMFRDPRAAAYSEIKAYFGSPAVSVTARRWRKYVMEHQRLVSIYPGDRYHMLRYKDLIEDPELSLKELATFLELPFESGMLTYYERDEKGFAEGEEGWKRGTLKPLQKGKNQEWKAGLDTWQASLVESVTGDLLSDMAYQPQQPSLRIDRKLWYYLVDMKRSAWSTLTGARDEGYVPQSDFTL